MTSRAFAICAVLLGIFALDVVPAAAVEGKPFAVTGFSLQTTAGTNLTGPRALKQEVEICQPCQIDNVPYVPAYTQAGGHPWGLTTTVKFASEELHTHDVVPTRDPKDVVVDIPPGLFGNPQSVPRCPLAVLTGFHHCPVDTQVGEYRLRVFGAKEIVGEIVNATPEAGQSAEFALQNHSNINFLLTAHLVRTSQGYGITVVDNGVPEVELTEAELTFWGVPADPSHDPLRGVECSTGGIGVGEFVQYCELPIGGERAGITPVPFLSLPTDCASGPALARVRADSWQEPGRALGNGRYEGYSEVATTMPPVTGCGLLRFEAGIEVTPDTLLADAPVGLGVNIKVPQDEDPGSFATPHLRNALVTLPEGMSISPSVVDGIEACNESGPEGINFTGPESEQVGPNGELQLAPGHCPDASIVGSATAITPLLPEPVEGHVYLARPACGAASQPECTERDAAEGKLYRLYLELGGTGGLADAGVNIKVEGKVQANPATGQLTTRFDQNPQAPFSELRVALKGGERSPLDNPAVCGQATSTADFTPWSAPGVTPEGLSVAGSPDATPLSYFNVSGCGTPPGLTPGFSAGTVSPQAGAFSPFTLDFSRRDREQYLSGIQVHTPPGLVGMLSSVPLCGEPAAASGHCPESSRIGTTRVASGAGSHPFEISGNVYLTTGYKGAPFGLSIVTDAVAGPFHLGLVVVRSRIDVDPVTSQLTVTSDPLPQIVFGVPLRLQRVTVNIDRPGFMFNPTSCKAQRVTATLSGSGQTLAGVFSPFAAAGCNSLAFKPDFKVSASGRTSKLNGASLDAKVIYPPYKPGSQANIGYVKVELPKQLPSRLTTLQQACLAAVFDANPANCPTHSVVGMARTTTPVLPVPLEGPVYFVSHGGEAFPSLVVVLQGDGVRVDLTGSTFISRSGVTSTTFHTVPDVPVNTFEIYLPQGRFSALGANGNLCRSNLVMPNEFIGQNGTRIRRATKITVTGCPKSRAKHAKKARKASHRRRAGQR